MKRLLITIIVLGLIGCTDKVVSVDYYKAHLDEANKELMRCFTVKGENNMNCENAHTAIAWKASKDDNEKTSKNLSKF
jgi:hypothetical protein